MHGTIESLFIVEQRPLAALDAIIPSWRELAGRALTPNVFYEPAFALAAAPTLGRDAIAILLWSRHAPRRLLGLFPARIERRRWGVPLPVMVGWTHPFAPLGTPLVDREIGEAAIAAWLDYVAGDPSLPKAVLLPYLPVDSPLTTALAAAVARRGGRCIDFAPHARALLAPGEARNGYLDHALGGKKRKELRRQRKRLADHGPIATVTARDPCTAARALEAFFALEAAGWKGRAGTAARDDCAIAAFVASAVIALAAEGKAQIDLLEASGNAIAALVTLRSGDQAWCWKIAYDESYARFSPGVQLLTDVTRALLDDPRIAQADSCAAADHPMIDHIWRERLAVSDLLISVGSPNAAFTAAHALETLRRTAIASAKTARKLLRRHRPVVARA